MKRIFKKNQMMITALAIMIAVAGYLNFAGAKLGEEDFLSLDGSDTELTYEISDEDDMYAISLTEDADGTVTEYTDIASLDTDDITVTDDYLTENIQAEDTTDDTEVPGEAVFTSTSAVSTLDGARLLKEQTLAKNKETLLEIINNENLTEAAKQDAVDSMLLMTENAQKETDAEMLLEAKGFTDCVVSISDTNVDVMVNAVSLTDTQTAQIMDIVQRKTATSAENIIITVSGTK